MRPRRHSRITPTQTVSTTILPVLCLLVASCQPGGEPTTKTTVSIPAAWKASGHASSTRISTGWVKDLNDPQLPRLINEATNHNPSLLAAAERLKAARTNLTRARANRAPSAHLSSTTSRSRTNTNSATGTRSYSSGKNISLGASWEIDLWGRLRDLHTAAIADYDAAIVDLRGTRLSLAANTAALWYNLISSQEQVKLAQKTLASYRKVEKIIERNYKAGTSRALELQLSRNNVFSAERILRSRLRNRGDARRNLELILGRYPAGNITAPSTLPNIKQSVPAGLPAELIKRRPDLVQARKQLEATFHRARAAQKNLLPSLRLTGSSGTSSSALRNLLDPGFLTSSISTSLSQSIFETGARRENARAAVARNRAAVHNFANVALNAFREVESALASEKWLKQQETYLRKELQQAALAERQAERDYAEGIEGVDIIDLLESQRRASNARSSLIDLQNQRIQNRINLHLALGGNFNS